MALAELFSSRITPGKLRDRDARFILWVKSAVLKAVYELRFRSVVSMHTRACERCTRERHQFVYGSHFKSFPASATFVYMQARLTTLGNFYWSLDSASLYTVGIIRNTKFFFYQNHMIRNELNFTLESSDLPKARQINPRKVLSQLALKKLAQRKQSVISPADKRATLETHTYI